MLDRIPQNPDTAHFVSVANSPDVMPEDWPRAGLASDARCHVFQTREFVETWCATFAPARKARPLLVTIRHSDGSPLLMLPLVIERRRATRVLTFMDAGVADYNAPILFPTATPWTEATARTLWAAIEKALPVYDIAFLDKMPAEVGGLQNPLALLADGPNDESCHGNVLTRPWKDVEATQPYLKTLKKNMRGLERIGRTEFLVAETDADRTLFFEAMIRQKQRRFEETRVPGFDAEPHKLAFFERANRVFAEAGALHVSALKVGDKIVATAWGLTRGKHLYDLLIGFEAGEWTKYSSGRALNLMLLKWLHDNGYTYLDHGIGNEAWKLEACETTVPLFRCTVARTAIGRAHAARLALVARIRATEAWQKIRPLKWIVLRALRKD